jgi:hypothetical protein
MEELETTETAESTPTWTTFTVNAKADLANELAGFLPRLPKDEIRCSRVYGDCYRCNWWKRSSGPVPVATIRYSRFLKVQKINGKLVIADLTIGAH